MPKTYETKSNNYIKKNPRRSRHTLIFLSWLVSVSDIESFYKRNARSQILGSNEWPRKLRPCFEVTDSIQWPVVFGFSIVPIDTDPCARMAFHGSYVLDGTDSAWIIGWMDSLVKFEGARIRGALHYSFGVSD
jgi:hypothetical protein